MNGPLSGVVSYGICSTSEPLTEEKETVRELMIKDS